MTKQAWQPDMAITSELVTTLLKEQFKCLAPFNVELLGEGWDNKVYLINDTFVFRFPQRQIATKLLERENRVLSYLQGKLALETPNPEYFGQPSDLYPYYFHGYRMISGQTAYQAGLTPKARNASIIKLAHFLKTLHNLPKNEVHTLGIQKPIFDKTNVSAITANTTERANYLIQHSHTEVNLKALEKEINHIKALKLPNKGVLIHGDLYSRHLMFEGEELTGIIDWGEVAINHPSIDLAVLFSFYDSSAHELFFDIYGEIDASTTAYAQFLGLYSAVNALVYAYDMNDVLLTQEARQSIRRINTDIIK